jgi:cytochrome c553
MSQLMRSLLWVVAGGVLGMNVALAEGNVEAGKVKANTCMGCHGIKGYTNVYPTYHVPRIGGLSAEYIVSALKAYKSGDRNHATMHAQAASLTDQDMADIAAFIVQSPAVK